MKANLCDRKMPSLVICLLLLASAVSRYDASEDVSTVANFGLDNGTQFEPLTVGLMELHGDHIGDNETIVVLADAGTTDTAYVEEGLTLPSKGSVDDIVELPRSELSVDEGHKGVVLHSPGEIPSGDTIVPAIQLQPVECYQCNSRNKGEETCADVEPKGLDKACTALPGGSRFIGCYKIEQWVDYDLNASNPNAAKAHHRVIRQCAWTKQKTGCIYRAGFGGRQTTCYCEGHLCNTGHETRPFAASAVILMTVISSVFVKLIS